MKTLLFADDNRNIRDFCKQELEDEGYRVLLARDGKEAVRVVRAERPHLAILDICMPGAGGLEAVERIRAIDPAIPIIFFTANDEDLMTDARSRFAAACVEKSGNLDELKRTVARLLSARGAHELFRVGLPPADPEKGNGLTRAKGAAAPSR